MLMKSVNLYTHYGLKAPGGTAGRLHSWTWQTSDEVSKSRRNPAVLILPGGAYRFTSERESEPIALRFVNCGYGAFVLEYTCAPYGFPTALREAAMAMRYIRENAETFQINPAMVAVVGFSAGGHLCGTLGMLYDCKEVADIGPAALLRPDALGLCYPVAISWGKTHEESMLNISQGDHSLRTRLSLENNVRSDMPPVFLWHTRDDATVPCKNSLILATALDEAGVDFAFHLYRHGRHGLSTADHLVYPADSIPEISWDVALWHTSMVRFFEEVGFHITDIK